MRANGGIDGGPVTAVIVEANHLACELLQKSLRIRKSQIQIMGSAVESDGALKLIHETHPDVAVISSQLEDGQLQGFRVVRELRAAQARTRAILLLGSRTRELVTDAFRCGAQGVLFRDEPLDTLAKSIHAVHRGQVWANSENMGYILEALGDTLHFQARDANGKNLLSKREAEVVRLVAEGMTNRAISVELGLREHTVRNYLFKVFEKLGISTRVELVLYCFQERQRKGLEGSHGHG